MKKRAKKKQTVLDQAAEFIALARREGCTHLKVGHFEVGFEPKESPNTHAIGFEISPSATGYTEDDDP